jgi:hypothetical protein
VVLIIFHCFFFSIIFFFCGAPQADGQTPLHIGAAEGDESIVKFFYTLHANASLADNEGKIDLCLSEACFSFKINSISNGRQYTPRRRLTLLYFFFLFLFLTFFFFGPEVHIVSIQTSRNTSSRDYEYSLQFKLVSQQRYITSRLYGSSYIFKNCTFEAGRAGINKHIRTSLWFQNSSYLFRKILYRKYRIKEENILFEINVVQVTQIFAFLSPYFHSFFFFCKLNESIRYDTA